MPRYKLTVEYAGTRYSGWQIQKNARTVQGEIARAIARLLGLDEDLAEALARHERIAAHDSSAIGIELACGL